MNKTKTQTKDNQKSVTKPLTPKQAQIKAENILKGIDNNNAIIAKRLELNEDAAKQLHVVVPMMGGLSNASFAPKPLTKTNGAAKTNAKLETKEKPEVKKASGKAATNGAAVKKPVAAKASGKPSGKPAIKMDERPALKTIIHTAITKNHNKPLGAAEIYQAVIEQHKFSRQSVYNALKDTTQFSKVENGYKNVTASSHSHANVTGEKDEADRFVENVEKSQSTASVV